MLIAKEKRKENIAEYILYLWQLEDLLRTLSLDEARIKAVLVDPATMPDDKKEQTFYWYMGIVSLLKDEGKEANGHTNHSIHLIKDLNDIHLYLLNRKKDEKYAMLYYKAKPDLELFKEKMGNSQLSDIEAAFHALYSRILLKLKREPISAETEEAFTNISRLIAYLSAKFHRYEKGEEEMDEL